MTRNRRRMYNKELRDTRVIGDQSDQRSKNSMVRPYSKKSIKWTDDDGFRMELSRWTAAWPIQRWNDGVAEDLRATGIEGWNEIGHDGDKWRDVQWWLKLLENRFVRGKEEETKFGKPQNGVFSFANYVFLQPCGCLGRITCFTRVTVY